MGDDLPKTWRWRNIKFPLYSPQSTSDTLTISDEAPPVIFTETITKPINPETK